MAQVAKTVKALCKVHSLRCMAKRFNEEMGFLEKITDAIVGSDRTIESAKLLQVRALMEMNRNINLERKTQNGDVIVKHAQESVRLLESLIPELFSYHKAKALSVVGRGQLS